MYRLIIRKLKKIYDYSILQKKILVTSHTIEKNLKIQSVLDDLHCYKLFTTENCILLNDILRNCFEWTSLTCNKYFFPSYMYIHLKDNGTLHVCRQNMNMIQPKIVNWNIFKQRKLNAEMKTGFMRLPSLQLVRQIFAENFETPCGFNYHLKRFFNLLPLTW